METTKNIHDNAGDTSQVGLPSGSQAGRLCSLFLNKDGHIDTTRRNLPHWEQGAKLQFITFRLGDSLPQSELRRMSEEKEQWLKAHPVPWTKKTEAEYHQTFSQHVDKWLDSGAGSCILRQPAAAEIVESALLFFDHKRYEVHGYVIMPNHVHILVEEFDGFPLHSVVHSWKSFTAKKINATTGRTGKVWAEEYYDRILRDEPHYNNVIGYILKNVNTAGVRWKVQGI